MEPERQEFKGHRIELRPREAAALRAEEAEGESEQKLLIDDVQIDYGKLPDGTYFLHEYAYDWTDNLIDLARKFIDYRIKTDEIQRGRQSNRRD